MKRTIRAILGLAAAVMVPVAAGADVTGFINDLVGGRAPGAGFAGTWYAASGSDIDHIIVTASDSGPARIQVFGRCEARICNWGALPAKLRTDGPASDAVRSLAADFNLGFAMRRLTLHRLPGNTLRFDMVTEFTDGSDRHDYETAGNLSSTPVRTAAVPAQPAEPVILRPGGEQTAVPAASPSHDNAMPVAAAAALPLDDCFPIDTDHVYAAPASGNWNLRDFLHVVQNFGPYRAAAAKGLAIIKFYRFDEVCRIGRGSTNMAFFKAAGEVPRQTMKGEDCTEIHPEKVVAVERDGDWNVTDGTHEIFDYGSDRQGAEQAVTVIKTLNLARQCYYDRANLSASYWISR